MPARKVLAWWPQRKGFGGLLRRNASQLPIAQSRAAMLVPS